MTVNEHTAVGIAQVVLFVPIVPISFYMLIRNWRYRPRTAWYPPAMFSLIRVVGGVMTIVEEQPQNHNDKGLMIATIVLLNVGLIPLLLAYLGYARLVLEHDFAHIPRVGIFLRLLKVMILVSTGLLGAAGGYAGQPENAAAQSSLSRAAYSLFVVVLVALFASFVGLALNQGQITRVNRVYVKWSLVAAIPLGVRALYGIIGVAVATGREYFTSVWSPLFGSATLFGLMALLPEVLVLCVYLSLSIYHLRTRGQGPREGGVDRRVKNGSSDMS